MNKDRKSVKYQGDTTEDIGYGGFKRTDNNLNFEAEALNALEKSLVQQMELAVLRKIKKEESVDRVAASVDNLVSKTMNNLTEIRNRKTVRNDENRGIICERDQALQDLRNTELAFCDVHKKYERAKTVIANLKKNEDLLRQRDEEMLLMMDSRDQKYQAFKQESEMTVEKMYLDLQGRVTTLENDNAKLVAQLRRCELRAETVNSELDQRRRENDELNKLADELMGGKKTNSWMDH